MRDGRFLGKLSLLALSIAISFLLLEFTYRVYLFGWKGLSITMMNSVQGIGTSGLIKASTHSEVLYELKPNLETYFKLVPFETNAQGLRDREYTIAKPGQTFRAVVLGDSFTMPAGVRAEESYHAVLEDRLNQESSHRSYEFINFGASGYGPRQYLGVLKHRALDYDPDLILIGFCFNNDHRIPQEHELTHPYRVKKTTRPFFSYPFAARRLLTELLDATSSLRGDLSRIERQSQAVKIPFYSEEETAYMSSLFSQISATGVEHDTPIVVVFLSHQSTEKWSQAAKELAKIVEGHGLYFLDTSPAFENTQLKDHRIYATDNHPNGRANKLFADTIYDYLHKMNLLKNRP
jgi:lysophospholipase L1-like esterase